MKKHQTPKDSTEKKQKELEFREELRKRVREAYLEAEEYLKRHPLPEKFKNIKSVKKLDPIQDKNPETNQDCSITSKNNLSESVSRVKPGRK